MNQICSILEFEGVRFRADRTASQRHSRESVGKRFLNHVKWTTCDGHGMMVRGRQEDENNTSRV